MVTLTRVQIAMLAVPLVALLGLAGSRIAKTGTTRGPERQAPLVLDAGRQEGAAAPRLVVHVTGAVRHGGLYRLAEGSRVADAIRRAGGPTPKALLSAINLASPLADGQQVLVPAKGPPGSEQTATGGKVSLATADVGDLDELPGIGPVTAQKIVDWRGTHGPFGSVDDLDAIPGIGPARVEQLRDLVTP
jgi:competence protein ComEA